NRSDVGLCFPSGNGLTFGVVLYIAIVLTLNLLIYVCILYSIHKKPKQIYFGNTSAVYGRGWWTHSLFFTSGIVWIIVPVSGNWENPILVHIFCVMASIVGLSLFLFYIILNPNIKDLYIQRFWRCK